MQTLGTKTNKKLQVYYLVSLNCIEDVYMTKCSNILTIYFLNINVDFKRVKTHSSVLREWRERVDISSAFGVILNHLSKSFN